MDGQEGVLDDDMQRVRILSTLESARPGRAAPSKVQRVKAASGKTWQLKALMGLMAAGILALLTAFALIVAEHRNGAELPSEQALASDTMTSAAGHGIAAKPAIAQQAATDRNNPLAALMTSPQGKPLATSSATPAATPPAGATIETVLTDPLPSSSPAHPAAAGRAEQAVAKTTLANTAAVVSMPAHANKAISPQTTAQHAQAPAPNTAPPMAIVAANDVPPSTKPSTSTSKRRNQASKQDDDVALLEAMFAHSSARKPAPSVADELQRCNSLSGASAATCRARVCVQNPTANACHQDP